MVSTAYSIEASIVARLCRAGMSKASIIEAYRRARLDGTCFIDEIYGCGELPADVVAACLAQVAGVSSGNIPAKAPIVAPRFDQLQHLGRISRTAIADADGMIRFYIAPKLSDIAAIRRNLSVGSPDRRRLTFTPPAVLADHLADYYREPLARRAAGMLEDAASGRSSRIVVDGGQGALMGAILTSMVFLSILSQQALFSALHAMLSGLFSSSVILRGMAVLHARRARRPPRLESTGGVPPVYSILVALYREAPVVPQLVRAMRELDWPPARLEVLFLCEADDRDTLRAFAAQKLPPGFRVVGVAGFGPRTKPKALNVGLQLVSGEFVVVYDAEDRPHRGQLREAWQRFSRGGPRLGCLQAPLDICNGRDGWIQRQFAFEYRVHFRGILPWMAAQRLVMPLGGSSNHFRRPSLAALGGWDAFNVTEDAELGLRLARSGYHSEMLTLPTYEDAPGEVGIWLKQRTRWMKGWIQTWLVEMRDPLPLLRQVGLRRFLLFHLSSAGLVASALIYPLMPFLVLDTMLRALWLGREALPFTCVLDFMNVALAFLTFHALGMIAGRGRPTDRGLLLLMPLYWLMISLAAWRAIGQLRLSPFLWEKTPHLPSRAPMQRNPTPEAQPREPPVPAEPITPPG